LIYEHACTLRCEGIVSQRLGSPYRSGPTINGSRRKIHSPQPSAAGARWIGRSGERRPLPSVVRCPAMAIAAAMFCYGHADQPISAQARYAAGTREILECRFKGRQIRDEYLIVDRGKLAGTGAHSYRVGDR
jgi:hypothetical protein